MPQNFNPQVVISDAFIPYQRMTVPNVNGNSIAYPWGMSPHLSPQVVDVCNREVPQDQPRQKFVLVTTKTPAENEPEYMGSPIHVQIPPQVVQHKCTISLS